MSPAADYQATDISKYRDLISQLRRAFWEECVCVLGSVGAGSDLVIINSFKYQRRK